MVEVLGLWRVPKRCEEDAGGVSSAERALSVLTAFRHGDRALSLAEIATRTGLVKSTIIRHADSLRRFGLLARLPDGRYRLDSEILRLATTYQHATDLSGRSESGRKNQKSGRTLNILLPDCLQWFGPTIVTIGPLASKYWRDPA